MREGRDGEDADVRLVEAFASRFGLSLEEIAGRLRLPPAAVAPYRRDDAPEWLRLALLGLAVEMQADRPSVAWLLARPASPADAPAIGATGPDAPPAEP